MALLSRLLKYYRPYAFGIITTSLVVIIGQSLVIFTSYMLGKSMDAILVLKNWDAFIICATIYGVAKFIDSPILAALKEHLRERLVKHEIPNDARAIALKKYCSMSGRQHKDNNFLLSSTVIQEGIDAIINLENNMFYVCIPLISYSIVMFGLLLTTNRYYFIIALVMSIIFVYESYRINEKIFPRLKKLRTKRQQVRGKKFRENLLNINLIQINGQEDKVVNDCIKDDLEVSKEEISIWDWYRLHTIPRSGVLSLGQSILLIVGGRMIFEGQITCGGFIMTWTCVEGIFAQLWNLGSLFRNTIDQLTNVESFFKFLDLEPGLKNGDKKIIFENSPKIEFKDVSYIYVPVDSLDKTHAEQATRSALRNINLTIESNEIIGVVGHSGAGKTTFIDLLLRFDDPTSGDILIDGHNLKQLDQVTYKHQIGCVSQRHEFFDQSFRSNILFPLNGSADSFTDKDIYDLCRMTRIDDVIDRYPNKLDARIGDRAKNLSGGEMQRLSIARMLSKKPKIVILDEATASLDSDNEEHIQDVIRETSKSRTTIIIAHRISTLRFVDRIIVIDQGEISDIGNHAELIERNEIYQKLVRKQQLSL